jgi:hypothetical protein
VENEEDSILRFAKLTFLSRGLGIGYWSLQLRPYDLQWPQLLGKGRGEYFSTPTDMSPPFSFLSELKEK